MSTEHPADDHAEQLETDVASRFGDRIEIIPRPGAHVCVHHDCSQTEDLAAVIHPHRGRRVLCPFHVNDYLGVKVR